MKPHKHAELIKAWADGAEIQIRGNGNSWHDCIDGLLTFSKDYQYRIKPDEPRLQDMYIYKNSSMGSCWIDERDPDKAEKDLGWEYVGRIEVFK